MEFWSCRGYLYCYLCVSYSKGVIDFVTWMVFLLPKYELQYLDAYLKVNA